MARKKVLRMGHPLLREKAREMSLSEITSNETQKLIKDMRETMHKEGGVGLAAPQIGEPLQLAIIEFDDEDVRYKLDLSQPLIVFINPTVKVLDETKTGMWEGCLSVPGLRYVERPRKIQVDFLNEQGMHKSLVVEDFLAIVFQHELDHLDGVLYIDKLVDSKKLSFLEEFEQFQAD